MTKNNGKTKDLIKKAVNVMIDLETMEWPPTCIAFLHQPVRPSKMKSMQTDILKEENLKN